MIFAIYKMWIKGSSDLLWTSFYITLCIIKNLCFKILEN